MSRVFVVDTQRRPLSPCTPARARLLLRTGKAAVLRHAPFTLILQYAVEEGRDQTTYRLKVDPGSHTTGLAMLNEQTGEVVWAAELVHRGEQVRAALHQRRQARRSRRSRHTRYRPARFQNRRRPVGWLPPSCRSRVQNVLTWAQRIGRLCPLTALSVEVVHFDTQQMQQPDIEGIEYQQGELAGYELREYLLEKWQRRCAYCDATNVPLQVEHIMPRSKGGSSRVSNLTLACEACNQAKGTQDVAVFLAEQPEVLARLEAQRKAPLQDAAAVNSTRTALVQALCDLGVPLETGSGGRTKYNRTQRGLPKTHWLDAACVGASTPPHLSVRHVQPLHITAMGRQRRQMCLMSRFGFPRTRAKERRCIHGFRTGDLVRAVVDTGKKAGSYTGRVAVRASGSFNITMAEKTVQGIAWRWCRILQHANGYAYSTKGGAAFPPHA